MHLLRSLPEPNLMTFLTLLEHLKRYPPLMAVSRPHARSALLFPEVTRVCLSSRSVAEKEPVNKMSLHNLATVFGPTLLRPSESESTKGQHITSASDIWSHDVMAQVHTHTYTRGEEHL